MLKRFIFWLCGIRQCIICGVLFTWGGHTGTNLYSTAVSECERCHVWEHYQHFPLSDAEIK